MRKKLKGIENIKILSNNKNIMVTKGGGIVATTRTLSTYPKHLLSNYRIQSNITLNQNKKEESINNQLINQKINGDNNDNKMNQLTHAPNTQSLDSKESRYKITQNQRQESIEKGLDPFL